MANKNNTKSQVIDISGQRFGRLTVIAQAGTAGKNALWICQCDCGGFKVVPGIRIRFGSVKSCGCIQKEKAAARLRTHGQSGTREYRIWNGISKRCLNPAFIGWRLYGSRGISVCDRWRQFENFLADMGPCPSSRHSLDRFPNADGNYEPENCRWATPKEQSRNKRNNRMLTVSGETHCVTEWAEIRSMSMRTILARLNLGWTHEQAVMGKQKEGVK